MRTVGVVAVMVVALGAVGYVAGWFSPTVEVNVNPEVTEKVETFTHDTLESAQDHTNRAFETLKNKTK